jgi:hypothetical protein
MMFHVGREEGVVVLLSLILIAALSAMLSLFMDHLLEDHPVGKWYLSLIQKLPEEIAKPVGECIICSGAWQYLFTAYFIFEIPFYLCLIGLGANHLFILLLLKIRNKE